MTVYLHCEGPNDYAVIPPLMKKVIKNSDLDIRWIKRDTLKKATIHRKSDIVISGHYKMIKALVVVSLKNDSKYIAYHQDADRKYTDVYRAINSEFDPLREKGFHCLSIVSKETIESWLLADENAYPAIPKNPALPGKPEEYWGKPHNPDSNHPKRYFYRVLEQFRLENKSDTYAQIAENSDIEVLKRRCPTSFGQFYADMQSF
ncbi:MAG: DUF4276 family protein [Treponema sp.]|jgi:hypothetical protein|nr:DUF4276 family protein [Treponema sp.]